MNTKKKAPALRDQILDFLRTHDEATLKQIAAATTERDYPSRVAAELNKLRVDAAVECKKKKGKSELWYWLASPSSAVPDSQPAVEQNTGSSAAGASATQPAGAAVHPKPAPAAAASPSAAPVAADVKPQTAEIPPQTTPQIPPPQYDPRSVAFSASARLDAEQDQQDAHYRLIGVLADIRAAVGDREGRLMQDELVERVRTVARRAIAYDDLEKIRSTLQPLVYTGDPVHSPGPVECAEHAAQWIESLSGTNREQLTAITCASETLAPLVLGDIDTSDMDLQEIAQKVAAVVNAHDDELLEQAKTIVEQRALLEAKDKELFGQVALVADLRAQIAVMQAATHLPRQDGYTPAAYLVRAPKRRLRAYRNADSAQAAALAAARNGSGRGEVFALVPVGKAVRGAEWRPA